MKVEKDKRFKIYDRVIKQAVHIPLKTETFDLESCLKGSWLLLLHARRMPPHVGLCIEGNYNSLTIKGHELNISVEAVYKTMVLKKIESLFIQFASHPVFSADYQLAVLQELVQKFPCVKPDEATCLSPIREFFQEFYALPLVDGELLFSFLERLNANNYLEKATGVNFEPGPGFIELPFYTTELLHLKITQERLPFYNAIN